MLKKHKKLIMVLSVLLLLVIGVFEGLFFYVNGLVKPELYKQQVLDSIKKQIGHNVKINGDVQFMLLPSPQMVFLNLEVDRDAASESSTPSFSIEKVIINISPMSILSNQITLSSVTLVNPVLSLERAVDNTIHWGWLNRKLLKALNTKNGNGVALPLFINNGVVSYKDNINNKNLLIENVDAYTTYGAQISLIGKMKTDEHTIDFVIDSKTADLPVKDTEFPINLRVSEGDKSVFNIQSVIDSSEDSPKVIGNFNLNTDDMLKWIVSSSQIVNPIDKSKVAKIETPLVVNGLWSLDADVLEIKDIVVNGLNSKGVGTANLRWENWYPTISTDLNFEYIDYLVWKKILESRVIVEAPKQYDEFQAEEEQSFDFRKENPLPENIEIRVNIFAEKILFAGEKWGHTRLNGVLDRGAFTVNQCDIDLDGDGLLSVFGVVSQGGTGELRFEGNMEAKGKSVHKAISMFYSSANDLPFVGKGEFSVSANMYVNSGQVRLFEANANIDGMEILGTVTTFLDEQTRIEAKLRLKDINFDYIRDKMREERAKEIAETKIKAAKEAVEGKENKLKNADKNTIPIADNEQNKVSFDWLKHLSTRFDIAVYVDGFTLMERKGDRASFFISAYRGELSFSNVQFAYPDGINQINCNLDVRGAQPYVALIANADRIDTSYFSLDAEDSVLLDPNKNITKEEYANYAIPLGWMDYFNGSFDITLRKITHKNLFMENIKLQARLDNKILNISRLGFVYSEAQSTIVGTLFGGKVPGLQINFTMANADIYGVIEPLIGLKSISGYASLSGTVYTTGWSFREWLQNMDSRFLVAARGVKVQGINLAGVVNAVDVARSSADVFNNVNNALTKGTTEFSVDGYLNVKKGELRAPSLVVRNGLITGSVVGGLKLDTLVGQFSTTFQFPNLSPESVPSMIILLSGKIDAPEIKVDTASLEVFVAKRNVSK